MLKPISDLNAKIIDHFKREYHEVHVLTGATREYLLNLTVPQYVSLLSANTFPNIGWFTTQCKLDVILVGIKASEYVMIGCKNHEWFYLNRFGSSESVQPVATGNLYSTLCDLFTETGFASAAQEIVAIHKSFYSPPSTERRITDVVVVEDDAELMRQFLALADRLGIASAIAPGIKDWRDDRVVREWHNHVLDTLELSVKGPGTGVDDFLSAMGRLAGESIARGDRPEGPKFFGLMTWNIQPSRTDCPVLYIVSTPRGGIVLRRMDSGVDVCFDFDRCSQYICDRLCADYEIFAGEEYGIEQIHAAFRGIYIDLFL